MTAQRALFLKNLPGLTIGCYVHSGKDEFYDDSYTYQVIIKGVLLQSWLDKHKGVGFNYFLARDVYVSATEKSKQEVKALLLAGVQGAARQIHSIQEKLDCDLKDLNAFILNER